MSEIQRAQQIVTTADASFTTTPSVLSAAKSRKAITIYNTGSVTARIGDSAITATRGFPLLAGERLVLEDNDEDIYARSESGTATLGCLEELY